MLLSSCKIALPQDLFQKLIGDPAQCRVRLQERLDVYGIVHNFVRIHFTTHQVPAVALGILEHGFSLHEIFLIQKIA